MKRTEALEIALTPSSHTKGLYSGEFYMTVEHHNPEYDADFDIHALDLNSLSDEEIGRIVRESMSPTLSIEHMIPWTTIKDIMKMIKDNADGLSSSD